MNDDASPFDDPFADLLGKLPDGRAPRAGDSAPSGSPTPADPVIPTSRRAARAARSDSPPSSDSAASTGTSQPATGGTSGEATTEEVPPELFWAAVTAPAAPSLTTAPARSADDRPRAVAAASLDDLFTGERTTEDVGVTPPPADRRRRRRRGWIALIVVLALLGALAAGGLWVWTTYEKQIREVMGWTEPAEYAPGEATGEALLTIESGDTGASISPKLFEAGVTRTSSAFYDYLIQTGQNPPFQPGTFRLQQKMTSEAALAAILDPANRLENTALIREGLTVDRTIETLASDLAIPLSDLQAAVADPSVYGVPATSLEGWLFPATYTFDPGTTATQIIQSMVDRTVASLDNAGVPVDDRERVLTIASIIEREARSENDFYNVSRVIQNRLDQGMRLQMDSTAQYGYGELHDGTASSSSEALADVNDWNTYVIDGLPKTPIANPGDRAIDAAMHPADGPWLYFVTVNLETGETVFSTTYEEHLAAVKRWQQWCTENPDGGC